MDFKKREELSFNDVYLLFNYIENLYEQIDYNLNEEEYLNIKKYIRKISEIIEKEKK